MTTNTARNAAAADGTRQTAGTGGTSVRAGTGTAVKFDAGKVLETWIVSTSIFGKLPEDARAPEK